MIDSHCHLDLPAFKDDIDDVIANSEKAGVTRFLVPGTTPSGWQRQLDLQSRYPQLDLAFGLHPYFFAEFNDSSVQALEKSLDEHRDILVAVGEIGLDATVDTSAQDQESLFSAQLALAKNFRLPVILHHHKTHHRLIGLLKEAAFPFKGIIHAFSGSEQVANDYIEMGFLLGIGGTITYERAKKTRNALANIPLRHLVLETDAPDMPMAGRQGLRNSPQYLPQIVEVLSELKATTSEDVIRQTSQNYCRLFKFSQTKSDL
ncbi:TatD family hydrolase [Alteromonas pelagimontana]|uniref:TatD family hydrolase n=1 Tax=Alteromonas pelagimontana TaxID=1858656 RepID=A0A6M4MFZ7_9ALTE|nr:TatD family hydrolase [Alteromonas pelagimontana]QJR82101.1 TatD family hydrolase [Alteromonas pelagimontana]